MSKANPETFIHDTADVSDLAKIGKGTTIWNNSQVREGASIGENCTISKGVYIDKKEEKTFQESLRVKTFP